MEVANTAPINPKPKPKAKVKTAPKAKSSPYKPKVVAGEKGVPCLFFPAGTCRRDPCPYLHA